MTNYLTRTVALLTAVENIITNYKQIIRLLRFFPFLKFLNMSSLIADKVETIMILVSLYCRQYLRTPLFPNYTTITACSIYFSHSYYYFAQNGYLQPRLFCSHETSYKADWILASRRLLCLALLQATVFRLMNWWWSDNTSGGKIGVSSSREFFCVYIVDWWTC